MPTLLALRPDFPVDALPSEPAKILARALRDYGAYVDDDTGWDVYALETQWGPDRRVVETRAARAGDRELKRPRSTRSSRGGTSSPRRPKAVG